MRTPAYILMILALMILLSCNSNNELNGYWREYNPNHPDLYHYFQITDSTFSVDYPVNGYQYDLEYEDKKAFILFDDMIQITNRYKIRQDKLYVNDTLWWIKYNYNDSLFIEDLSGSLIVNVLPNEIDENGEYFDFDIPTAAYIMIGRVKDSFKDKAFERSIYNYNGFYIQLNDWFGDLDNVIEFCVNMDDVILHMDRDVPIEFVDLLESIINRFGNVKIYKSYMDIQRRELKIKELD